MSDDTVIRSVGNVVRDKKALIVQLLDKSLAHAQRDDVLLAFVHPTSILSTMMFEGRHGVLALSRATTSDLMYQAAMALEETEACEALMQMSGMLSIPAPCGHTNLLVALPKGQQLCCPECDYDVRGTKDN